MQKSNDSITLQSFLHSVMGKHNYCCVGGCDNDKRYLHVCVSAATWRAIYSASHGFVKTQRSLKSGEKILSKDSNSLILDMKPFLF